MFSLKLRYGIQESRNDPLIFIRCESAEEARDVVRWSKFDPLGERGFDRGSADNNFSLYPNSSYIQDANDNTWIVAQVESPKAVEHAQEIAEVDGIDCLFFGPGDYSALTGRPGDVKGEKTLEAARKTAERAQKAGKIFGTLVFDFEHAKYMKDLGAKLLVHSADIVLYKDAYSNVLEKYSAIL